MKIKVIVVSTILAISLATMSTFAWFTASESEANEFQLGTVEVEVVEPGFSDLTGVEADTYDKNVMVKSLGTKRTYVRVRLIPEWSDPSLPVSNVELNLSSNGDWTQLQPDGYYYYKHILFEGEETSLLLSSVTFNELGPEYDGETFTLKVVAEGVQITHNAWQDVWGLTDLPF